MILEHTFEVPIPVEDAWRTFSDLEAVAPCLPGAKLDYVEGLEHHGTIDVKLGSITATFVGAARFVEQDERSKRAVLQAEGRDQRGAGQATATIAAEFKAHGESTTVEIVTDLKLSGKIAQFGRGVLPAVSTKMIDQFVDNLQQQLALGADSVPQNTGAVSQPMEVDLKDLVDPKAAARYMSVVVGAAFSWLVLQRIRRLRHSSTS